ncbi:hypothetical protein RHMOL_Rhmol01G0039100 [Rhododendron molle]|uniref:Uncharacterized protein n=1 Tax=Rhododendron molle TaxID=49168 RepID=A0ACC0PXU2_RHOML|nr:hypothetical protein RHMOL_Rhmol01G0039100 [Rhododendron molle]
MKEKTEGGELGQLKDVNVRNGSGWTALDIHFRVAESESEKSEDKKSKAYRDIGDVLRDSGANRRKQNAGNGGKLVRPKEVVVALEE